jgi:hypothetical protein
MHPFSVQGQEGVMLRPVVLVAVSPTRAKVLYTSAYTMSSFEITPDGGFTNYVLDVTNKVRHEAAARRGLLCVGVSDVCVWCVCPVWCGVLPWSLPE